MEKGATTTQQPTESPGAAPKGKFYRDLYIDPGAPSDDSPRLRSRLLGFYEKFIGDAHGRRISERLQMQFGIEIMLRGAVEPYYDFRSFFREAAIVDLLHSITVIWQILKEQRQDRLADNWAKFADKAFREENVGFTIDDQGGAHPFIDADFQGNQAAAIAALTGDRYRAAREDFERGRRALDEVPPDMKTAIRCTFEAAEGVFKLICNVPRLDSGAVERRLKPMVLALYAGNGPAARAANHVLNSLADWVDAAHNYRHAPGTEEPMPPPLDLATGLISAGAAWVRWLAEIDRQLVAKLAQPAALPVSQ